MRFLQRTRFYCVECDRETWANEKAPPMRRRLCKRCYDEMRKEMMEVKVYKGGIFRDRSLQGDQVYAGNGQGCRIICYKSVSQARRVITRLGHIPDGTESGLCASCGYHYPFGSEEWEKHPKGACRDWKEQVAQS